MKYIPLFILIQLVSLVLSVVGIPLVAVCLLLPKWPRFAWVWFNDEDGYGPKAGYWNKFVWLALRNSVNNLRYVPGVSKVGRPLYYRIWLVEGRTFYFKAGWLGDGYPALSAGAGIGY